MYKTLTATRTLSFFKYSTNALLEILLCSFSIPILFEISGNFLRRLGGWLRSISWIFHTVENFVYEYIFYRRWMQQCSLGLELWQYWNWYSVLTFCCNLQTNNGFWKNMSLVSHTLHNEDFIGKCESINN